VSFFRFFNGILGSQHESFCRRSNSSSATRPSVQDRVVRILRGPSRFSTLPFGAMMLGTITVAQASQYLNLPSSVGGTTTWSPISGPVGSAAGNTIASSSGGSAAASFSNSGTTYSAQTSVYLDASALSAATYTIDTSASDIIDLNGKAFTVNGLAGQTINFVAALGNSQAGRLVCPTDRCYPVPGPPGPQSAAGPRSGRW